MRPTDILRSLTVQPVDCKELFDYLPERYYQDPVTFLGDPLSRLWEQFSRMALDDRHQQIRSWKRRACTRSKGYLKRGPASWMVSNTGSLFD
ncbi:hypothetical protein BK809_0001979 [Diplodia seriata]|uniref:Uncharacterized protein n=1 Tax=Diplodia seriata TaxID=420778 RepID=A0A1S8BEL5_9PEZI|nr:hypothetical protein BK809_0001979 [Diplodia seriata]